MRRIARIGYPFIAIGFAFIAIGANGRRAFLAIGAAFLVLAFVTLRKS